MKKNKDRASVREALSANLRAAKIVNKMVPGFFPAIFAKSFADAIAPYTTIYLSARLIDELAFLRRPKELAFWALMVIGVTAFMGVLKALTKRFHNIKENEYYTAHNYLLSEKMFQMDFADADKPETNDTLTQILQSAGWGGWGFNYIPMYVGYCSEAIFGIIGAFALTISLFTSPVPDTAGNLTVLNHPIFIVGILAVMILFTLIGPFAANLSNAAWASLAEDSRFGNRLFSGFAFLFDDRKKAMDLRMYNQANMSKDYLSKENMFGVGSRSAQLSKGYIGITQSISEGSSSVFSGIVYVFVCLKAWAGAFGIGSVTQYIGAVTALSGNIALLIQMIGHMQSNTTFLKTIFEFLDIPNSMYQGSLSTEKRSDKQYEVEFKDVSFKYPGSDLWALRHVNMKFKVGNRLAVVGENGSGKTTFIKLLCRLYDPQEGEILLNGIDIRKYNYQDYKDIFSVVFQDFQLVSQPLGANVASGMEYDKEKVTQCLIDAGFGERLNSLPQGLDTCLYKDFGEEGIDVSGGEAQKIAIARALYKDAAFIILDEPTAALDPIAEAEIYSKFNDIVGDKTAVYISHRLSSCRFCDDILVFDQGNVIEHGTHEELVADTNSKYFKLWNAQAQYYA